MGYGLKSLLTGRAVLVIFGVLLVLGNSLANAVFNSLGIERKARGFESQMFFYAMNWTSC